MAKKKYIDYKKMQAELFKRTEGYAANVRIIYQQVFERIINLVKGTELEDGKPFSFADYGYSEEVTPILRDMYSRVYQIIRGGVEKEWLASNENNDALVKSVFGEQSISSTGVSVSRWGKMRTGNQSMVESGNAGFGTKKPTPTNGWMIARNIFIRGGACTVHPHVTPKGLHGLKPTLRIVQPILSVGRNSTLW